MTSSITDRSTWSLDDKLKLLSGHDFWHLPALPHHQLRSLCLTDGPHGVRLQQAQSDHLGLAKSIPATCFPTASALACSWNPQLLEQVGACLGKEAVSLGVDVLLGPGANLKRHPGCGRNFEYFSEDPLLSGQLAAGWIRGLQSQHVAASLKHFALNNQETWRMVSNSIVDERTLRELYLKSFEIAIEEGQPWTLMTSYNRVNGDYVGEHPVLLRDIVRQEWGYEGVVISDWLALNDPIKARLAGLDVEMPGNHHVYQPILTHAIHHGQLTEKVINDSVDRVCELIERTTLMADRPIIDVDAHHELARRVAQETIVLLKNDHHDLPLASTASVAIIGAFAKNPRYQGAGSSQVEPTRLSTLWDVLSRQLEQPPLYAPGYQVDSLDVQESLIQEALEIASQVDRVLVCIGLPAIAESEGFDRRTDQLPDSHNRLIQELVRHHPHVIVCCMNGAPFAMPWINDVATLVETYLGGQAGADALADVVLGRVNPSGRLAETFPHQWDELPANANFGLSQHDISYLERCAIGYRAYSPEHPPLFAFGYGLSYTTFDYSHLHITWINNQLDVQVTVHNRGSRAGNDVVQVYTSLAQSCVERPARELKGYQKVWVEAGQQKTIHLTIPRSRFTVWNNHAWRLEAGEYRVEIGHSAMNCPLQELITIPSSDVLIPDAIALDREPRVTHVFAKQRYHPNTLVVELEHHWFGQYLYRAIQHQSQKMLSHTTDPLAKRLMEQMVNEMPLRAVMVSSQGGITPRRMEGVIDCLNNRVARGIWKLIIG